MRRTPRAARCVVRRRSTSWDWGQPSGGTTVILLGLIKLGQAHFDSVGTGQSIAFTALALCLTVAAFEWRSETDSVLDDVHLRQQTDELGGTGPVRARNSGDPDGRLPPHPRDDPINARQFGWALLAALTLLLLWELGKLLARRSREA